MIHVVLATPSEIEREGVKRRLSGESDILVSREADSERQLLAVLRNERFDVLVLDPRLVRAPGLRLIRRARIVARTLPILVFTDASESEVGVRSIRAGARGFLAKDATSTEAITSIRALANGAFYVPPKLAEELALSITQCVNTRSHFSLSDRDFEVFLLLAAGDSVREIAETLRLSVKTVGVRKSQIMQRMNLGSISALVQYAVAHRLINSDSSRGS